MNYNEAVDYLFGAVPAFETLGDKGYKPGLDTVRHLAAAWGDPQTRYPSIHVGGTNGKGSVSHTLAAILMAAGYRVGLFTSPHLVDFRERIKVDGVMIDEGSVTDFVNRYQAAQLSISPSFFELTTVMAFDYFARRKVDVAVIEVGLGGRLDSTNIITPQLSVITNISLDHCKQLGDTAASIAAEKAGIIKHGVKAVIGNPAGDGVREVFETVAREKGAPIEFASDRRWFENAGRVDDRIIYKSTYAGDIIGELTGDYQIENTATVLCAVKSLRETGLIIPDEAVKRGFASAATSTGLVGRWTTLSGSPKVICDTGHNPGGWAFLSKALDGHGERLNMVIGFVGDKDVRSILAMMPKRAKYYFTRPSSSRGLPEQELKLAAEAEGLRGEAYADGVDAYRAAVADAAASGKTVFVGGSTYLVGDIIGAL